MTASTVDVLITVDTAPLRAALDELVVLVGDFVTYQQRVHGRVPFKRNARRYGR